MLRQSDYQINNIEKGAKNISENIVSDFREEIIINVGWQTKPFESFSSNK